MKTFRTGESRSQLKFLPPSIDDYVGADDFVRYIDTLIEELDLSRVEKCYSSIGRPAYSPRLLVKVILYGKMRGIRSGRELSVACKENLRFIFLARNEKPDFRTINDFRKLQSENLAGLLRQTIEIGLNAGLIDLKAVCIDGTKLAASAGRNSFKTPNNLREELDKLEKDLAESFREDIENEKDEDGRHGDDDGEKRLPTELANKEKLKEKLQRAIKEHAECERKDKPSAISTTDPECRMMRGKGTNPSYNAQAAIDAKSRMAVGGYVTNACCDGGELISAIENIKANTGRNPDLVSADRGYTTLDHLVELETRGIDGFISQRKRRRQDFQYDSGKDIYLCPEGKELLRVYTTADHVRYARSDCNDCARKEGCWRKNAKRRSICVSSSENAALRMWDKVQSHRGKEISVLRASTIEPLFGTIKFAKRLRQLTVRGLKRVSEVWELELAAYNIQKLYTARIAA